MLQPTVYRPSTLIAQLRASGAAPAAGPIIRDSGARAVGDEPAAPAAGRSALVSLGA